MTRTIVSLVAALALAACGSDSPTATQTPGGDRSLVGTYVLTEVSGEAVPVAGSGGYYKSGAVTIRTDGTATFAFDYDRMIAEGVREADSFEMTGVYEVLGDGEHRAFRIKSVTDRVVSGQITRSEIILLRFNMDEFRFDRRR